MIPLYKENVTSASLSSFATLHIHKKIGDRTDICSIALVNTHAFIILLLNTQLASWLSKTTSLKRSPLILSSSISNW